MDLFLYLYSRRISTSTRYFRNLRDNLVILFDSRQRQSWIKANSGYTEWSFFEINTIYGQETLTLDWNDSLKRYPRCAIFKKFPFPDKGRAFFKPQENSSLFLSLSLFIFLFLPFFACEIFRYELTPLRAPSNRAFQLDRVKPSTTTE